MGAMSRMQQGGIPNGPEATADVTRSPIIRELFEEVVKSARMSPEYRGLRSEMNSPINRGEVAFLMRLEDKTLIGLKNDCWMQTLLDSVVLFQWTLIKLL